MIFVGNLNVKELLEITRALLFIQVFYCFSDGCQSSQDWYYTEEDSLDGDSVNLNPFSEPKSSKQKPSTEYVTYKSNLYAHFNLSDNSKDDDKHFAFVRNHNIQEVGKIIRRMSFSTLNLKVGKVIDVNFHPNHTKYYVLNLDVGERNFRQAVTGARPYYKRNELMSRLVVCLTNTKSVLIHGVNSQLMVLYGMREDMVELLEPPKGASFGERIYTTNHQPRPAKSIMAYKKDWLKIIRNLHILRYRAYYKSVPLIVMARKRNYITCRSLSHGFISEPVFD